MSVGIGVLGMLIALALAFDFMNGFHDAANSIATVVSTGVLKPQQAVAFAAAFNVIAYFIFHLKVAQTVGKGTIDPGIVDHYVVFGALVGAIGWNVVTWYYGIPSSSSHALFGRLNNQVSRFQMMPPARPAATTCSVTSAVLTRPLAIVAATASERNAPTRLSRPDKATATRGGSAPVAIEVAIALPVS